MSFLPSPDVPALLFMGVPEDEKSALFFVHPGLSHQGEGVCMPSKAKCNFLELGIGREHYLSVDDYEFRIQLLDIKRVKLSEERKQRAQARKTARLRVGPRRRPARRRRRWATATTGRCSSTASASAPRDSSRAQALG